MSECAELVRIAVIGDCPVFRHGISQLIGTAPDLHLVAAVPSIESADGSLRGAEVVLMDLQQSAPRLAATVTKLRRKGHAVLVVSSSPQLDAVQVIQAGASGYLSRQVGGEELLAAIGAVGRGRRLCVRAGQPSGRTVPPFHGPGAGNPVPSRQWFEDHEIAAALGISKHTVQSHLDRIGEKTGSRRRPDLTESPSKTVSPAEIETAVGSSPRRPWVKSRISRIAIERFYGFSPPA